ncbi:serine/threonine-protein kinase [Hyalangium minutum]|uniref:serine/threonine-protein kinase n=1 Tax=Hyalangium minutum TaxID=394096 RepID=UPI00094B4287
MATHSPKRAPQLKGISTDSAPQEPPPRDYVEYFKSINLVLGPRLGVGGSGNVYRATQTRLRRDLAIKLFDHQRFRADPNGRKRFEHEARMLAIAQHPSIPFVISSGDMPMRGEAPIPYIIMQFIDGTSLETVVEKSRTAPQLAASYMKQVLAALSCAHSHRLVHRDVKPANILLSKDGHCYLIDFSIGVSLGVIPGLTRITGEGRHPATWRYASPEQIEGRDVDHRTDLYSAGLVLFELLAGRRISMPEVPAADMLQLPPVAKELLRKACHSDPAQRFQTAKEFLGALNRLEAPGISRSEPRDALCLNLTCATWDQFTGEYENPLVVEATTKSFCKDCRSPLVYPCAQCGAEYDNAPFCADCGHQHYTIPSCAKCGNRLTFLDANKNTILAGCSRCPSSEDDIPF